MNFTIVIPGFNGPKRIDALLESIFKFCPNISPGKIIVSDDCSPKQVEVEAVATKYGVRFTYPDEWSGVGGNTNHVVGMADDDLVFVINDDLIISRGTLEGMQKFWEDNRHLSLGAAGFTFIQDYQLVEKGVIESKDTFYPTTWNTGNISYNALQFKKYVAFPLNFKRPFPVTTPSGPCFAISKTAWEEVGRFHEFGIWEGGAFHAMWERGYVICMVPTPPLFHAVSSAHVDTSGFLRAVYQQHPEKRAWKHDAGEALYKARRGRGYDEDTTHIWATYVTPRTAEITRLLKCPEEPDAR